MTRSAQAFVALTAFAACGCQVAPASSEFPDEYLGRWGESAAGCSAGAVHGGLSIGRSSIADGEFSGDVRSVSRKPDGLIDVTELWDVPEEGPMTVVNNYRVFVDGSALMVREINSNDREAAEATTLIRCRARHV